MAESRYDFSNNVKTDTSGKKVYVSILYPEILASEDDIFIDAKETDRLDTLAYKYYGDVTKWWIIAHANHITGSMFAPLNTQIRIPMNLNAISSNLKRINEV